MPQRLTVKTLSPEHLDFKENETMPFKMTTEQCQAAIAAIFAADPEPALEIFRPRGFGTPSWRPDPDEPDEDIQKMLDDIKRDVSTPEKWNECGNFAPSDYSNDDNHVDFDDEEVEEEDVNWVWLFYSDDYDSQLGFHLFEMKDGTFKLGSYCGD